MSAVPMMRGHVFRVFNHDYIKHSNRQFIINCNAHIILKENNMQHNK